MLFVTFAFGIFLISRLLIFQDFRFVVQINKNVKKIILVFISITLLTATLLFFIIKYLREKPFGRQLVTHHLSVNLATAIFSGVAFLSAIIIVRELIGPFEEWVPIVVLVTQQIINLCVLMCMLSMQVEQFCNVFAFQCKFGNFKTIKHFTIFHAFKARQV